jgi:sec-independent protein translocase protein TatA
MASRYSGTLFYWKTLLRLTDSAYFQYLCILSIIYHKLHSMFGLGPNEVILIVVLVLILFGGRKIPELMRGLGRGVREFNDAKNNVRREIEEGVSEKDKKTTAS